MAPEQLQQWLDSSEPAPLIISSPRQAPLDEAYAVITEASAEHIVLEPDKGTISIKAVREMLSAVAATSWQGRRTVIIREAESLTAQASSALLKILEDASAQTRFVLITRWPQRLLTTIRSRCQQIRLKTARVPSADSVQPLPGVLELLSENAKAHHLDDELLGQIQEALEAQLRDQGPSPQLKIAYQRLRDYYLISSRRGSTKLSKDVLLGALPRK
ncbi:hypothetical protein CL628_04535 [bacterium]|nr:hypothetical protein [bacterium]|tara:strand:+ start:243 stop:893 length:651 start_codon:yes stop_codon:yes gene_type:complete